MKNDPVTNVTHYANVTLAVATEPKFFCLFVCFFLLLSLSSFSVFYHCKLGSVIFGYVTFHISVCIFSRLLFRLASSMVNHVVDVVSVF